MEKYDKGNYNFYSNLLDEIKENFNLDNEEAEAALLLIKERALSLDLSLHEYMKTYHPQGFSEKDNSLNYEYKGYIQFIGEEASSIIKTGKNADFSTFTHEVAHGFRRQLSGELKEIAERVFKVENGNWSELQEEAFALGFEEYIRLRLTENEELKKVFEKGSLYMQRVYNGLDRIIKLNPEIIKVYDQMFTHGRFQFNQEEFDKTIDNIANFKDETAKFSSSHVYLGMTPPIYQELGFERLPVMITAKHLQNIMSETGKDRKTNYHRLTADMVKQIPEAIKKPLLIMQSQNAANAEDIISVIELKDKRGNPIIIPLSPNKKGYFNDLEIDINLAKTVYGKDNFQRFLKSAIEQNRILYLNEKSRELTIPELQLLRNHKSQLLYNNIAEYHKSVKEKNPDFNILYQKVYHGSRYDFDEFNSSYIGSGEGASGWGYGFYFSEDKADAADYARKLEYEDGEGRVYTVSIPSTRHFLDISRDMYFQKQSEEVKRSLKKLNKELKDTSIGEALSSHSNTFFNQLQEEFGSEYEACEYLKQSGIKGITHTEFGNRHFIVFDDENIKISKKQNLKNIRVLYQKQAYYSGEQFEFDFLNDPEKKEEQKIEEKPIQVQNENKVFVNHENTQKISIIAQTDKIKIVNNTEMQRVQLFFPKAPDADIRNDLKSHGWRWSPRNFCWQRLNTENGIKDAMRVFDKWYKEKSLQEEYDTLVKKVEKQHEGLIKDADYWFPVDTGDYLKEEDEWKTVFKNTPIQIDHLPYNTSCTPEEFLNEIAKSGKYTEEQIQKTEEIIKGNSITVRILEHRIKASQNLKEKLPKWIEAAQKSIQTGQLWEHYGDELKKIRDTINDENIKNLQDRIILNKIRIIKMDDVISTFENQLKKYNKLETEKSIDYNETEENKEKPNGKERNNNEGRNTGVDDSGTNRGRTEAIGRDSDGASKDEIPQGVPDGQRERSQMGNSHESQNGQGNNKAEYQVQPNQPRNRLIDDDKKTLKEVKSIREICLNLLNSKKDNEFTGEDKKLLAQYEGGGGTGEENRSTSGILYEFYTPNSVVNKVWELIDTYAPNAKTVLEPSGGIGRFIQGRDKNECTLIELDKTSSRIASILHPNVLVKNQAFQELFFKDGVIHKENYDGKKYDLVIGNPPYGEYTGLYKGKGEGKKHSRYEQYFIERSLDTLNENGILAFVLPSSFLSNGENEGKRLIASKGELIDAWRLPSGVFNTTDVGTDIVIIKKGKGNIKDFCSDSFFSLNPDHVLGEEKEVLGRFGRLEKRIIPFEGFSTQKTLDLIVPKNISFNAKENTKVSNLTEKGKAFIKREDTGKSKEVNKVKDNIFKSYLLSAEEFSLKYGKEIDKRELPIWKLTDYEGKINESEMSKEDIDFMSNSLNYVKIDSSSWMHVVNYAKGNLYERLDELEKEAHNMDFQVYVRKKKILQNAIPKKIPYEKINIPVHSSIAQEFIVGKNPDGTDVNLQEGFIKWATGEKEQKEAQANSLKNYTTTYFIDYEYSPLSHDDIPENIGWHDIISFIERDPVRARAADGKEAKKAAQIEAQKKRNARRDTAERLFNRYIQEGVPQHLKENLCDMWNRRFNGYANPDYSKFPLFVEGMNRFKNDEEFTLYDQQIKGVSFLSNKGNGLLAYDVGVGKTACGIVFNANQIQSGRAKRPLICVPKSVYSKWVKDIKELFPNIKVNELENFSKEALKPFIADDHGLNIPEKSISVCTIEALQKITFLQETIDNEIVADLLDARFNSTGNARTDAQDKERIYEILGGATQAKDDDYIFWEKTGFDCITVDEAHRFKNLFTMPRASKDDEKKQTANEFEGIGSGVPSKRAQKLFAITQLIQKENNGRNVCLLTATPFTNSPTEVYSMLSYVARQKLKDMHIYNLSAFMTEFSETKTEWVVKPNGDIQPKQVMKNFKNLKSLQNLLTEYIDKVDAEEAGVIRPEKKPHVIELEMNDIQKKIIEAETNRMQQASKDDPGAVLVAMNNMRMALLSPALVNPVYDFETPPASKIVESSPKLTFVCESIIASYKKEPQGGQVMYMPRGVTEFSHVKDYLVSHGIPKEAIALVSSSTSNAQKDKITEDFNDKNKKLKIIIGSETISEGIDLNGNSFALYNTMLGWNPTENVQVEGRIWRQGNEQGKVHIVYPVIYDSIDSLMLQKHDEKASRIKDLWSYKGDKLNVEDIHPEELKFDLIKDPKKKADFVIDKKISDFKKDISVINMKRKSIDEIIEKRKEYKEKLAYYEMTSDKKKISFFKNRLASLDKKFKSFGITSEKDQYEVLAKLNKESNELITKIDLVTNEKGELIEKFTAEAEKNQKALLPIHEIIKDNCSKILNDLCPMEKLKEEYKIKKGQINEVRTTSSIEHSISKSDNLKKESAPLKFYKQAPFEFMVAEKRSDFFNSKPYKNDKPIDFKKLEPEIKAINEMKANAILETYTNTDYLKSKKTFAKGFFINDSVVYDETPALKSEIEDLKKFIIAKNNPEYDNRYFMQKMGVCDGFLCATDGKVLKRIKLGGLERLENRSCVKVEYKDKKIIIRYDREQKNIKNEYPPAANIVPEGKAIIKFDNERIKTIIQNLESWDILKPQPKREYDWDKNVLPLEIKDKGIYIGNEKIGIAENTSQDKFFIKVNYLHLKKALKNEKNTIFRLDDTKKSKINGNTYHEDILHQETEYSSTIIKLIERNRKVPEIFNSKELSNFLNTKAPIHKRVENSIER